MDGLNRKLSLSRPIVEIGIFSTVINLLLLVMPLYMLQVYDRVIPSSSYDTLAYISVISVFALIVLGVLEAVRALYANRLAARMDLTYGPRLFRAAIESPRATLGEAQPLRDLATVRNFIGSRTIFYLFDLPYGPFFIALLYLVHPVLFGIALAGAILMVILAVANQRATAASGKTASEALNSALTSAQLFARNAETVRTLGMVGGATDQWGRRFARSLRASDRLVTVNATYGSISRGLRLLLQIAMYGFGGYLTLKGEMTAGMIFAASMVSARAMQPLDQIVGSWKQITDANLAWKRISRLMENDAETPSRLDLPAPEGAIAVESLVYYVPDGANGAPPLIKGINFALPAGRTLAVVGPSRAGKSTLVRLLVGAVAPYSGTVRLDGADIASWDRELLGSHIGYLAQEVELFPGTIAENIARFDADASSEAIMAAAERAEVHRMILSQPDGYDTRIGPMGVRLSGGERQRIGLARAFFGDPKLIVLDEPNANLDGEGEAALARAVLAAKSRGCTVVVITHRPSLASECDDILMLRDGRIEHYGAAGDVMRRIMPGAGRSLSGSDAGAPPARLSSTGRG